jgi:ankyrin repeat protein
MVPIQDGETALSLVCFHATPSAKHTTCQIVRYLVEQGASIYHNNNRGRTPFSYSSRHPAVLAVLQEGLNVRRKLLIDTFGHSMVLSSSPVFLCWVYDKKTWTCLP